VALKHTVVHAVQLRVLNPGIRLLLERGVLPPAYALLETTGRRSGQPRRTPVGNGLDADGRTFWLVAEHGRRAGYVRNLEADGRVRLRLRDGARGSAPRWRTGTAHVLDGEDPREVQRRIAHGDPARWVNGFVVRTLGTDLLVIRVDLDPA
jgi:deazaflavin-dependent oxidoreductase (nitroreductase family)